MNLPKCQFCKRRLTADESIKNGVGPECAQKRTTFIGGCGTSDREISSLRDSNDSQVQRWVNLFERAVAAKDKRYAKNYIEAARRAATSVELIAA